VLGPFNQRLSPKSAYGLGVAAPDRNVESRGTAGNPERYVVTRGRAPRAVHCGGPSSDCVIPVLWLPLGKGGRREPHRCFIDPIAVALISTTCKTPEESSAFCEQFQRAYDQAMGLRRQREPRRG
jgi:hypothetical protein